MDDLPIALSPVSLANVLDQSVDCVKLINPEGQILYMNPNGRCAMEIDDFATVKGKRWSSFWPTETADKIEAAYDQAKFGDAVQFRAFCPTAKGNPRWWDVSISTVLDTNGSHGGFLAISRDVTENQMILNDAIVTTEYLRHQLSNTYATVCATLRQYSVGNPVRSDFAEPMIKLFSAMGRAKEAFMIESKSCNLRDLINAVTAPFRQDVVRLDLTGLPDTSVSAHWANTLSLVLAELALNSSKHGALEYGGKILIFGHWVEGVLSLTWSETSRAHVDMTERDSGHGLRLISRVMVMQGGAIEYVWKPNGLDAKLTLKADFGAPMITRGIKVTA